MKKGKFTKVGAVGSGSNQPAVKLLNFEAILENMFKGAMCMYIIYIYIHLKLEVFQTRNKEKRKENKKQRHAKTHQLFW